MRDDTRARLIDLGLTELPQSIFEAPITILQLAGNAFQALPPQLASCPSLTDLGLDSNELRDLHPETLSCLSTLRALSLTGNKLTEVPPEIGKLGALTLLALGGNEISELPREIGSCSSLRTLTLSENALTALPSELGRLQMLRTLRLDGNPSLTCLPDSLCDLRALEALSVCACGLRKLPGRLGEMSALSTLLANDDRLEGLPTSIGGLQRLRTLGLSGNQLRSLPTTLGACAALRTLSLSANRLKELPAELRGLNRLEELLLDDNPLGALPAELPPALRVLGVSVCTGVRELPESLGYLSQLTQLAIGAARLEALPASTSRLVRLQTLVLSGNVLRTLPPNLGALACKCSPPRPFPTGTLPPNLGALASLATLDVSDNRLEKLPESICSLSVLTTLRAAENGLEALPELVGDLRSLQVLSIAANRLRRLPDSIGNLTSLQLLDVSSNQLEELPATMGSRWGELRQLFLDDNEISSLPASLGGLHVCEELGLAFNSLTKLPTWLLEGSLTKLRTLRLHSNLLWRPPAPQEWNALSIAANRLTLFDNPWCATLPCGHRAVGGLGMPLPPRAENSGPRVCSTQRPSIALLLPGLLRNYAHGAHWKRFVSALSAAYEVQVYICLWAIRGSPANHFAQNADKEHAARVDLEALAAAYPPAAAVELVGLEHWIDQDREGHDGRYANQWAMVARCWALMERSAQRSVEPDACPTYVIRARPDLRVACLPLPLEQPSPYLAIQERLWGSDCFFYGDYESMRAVCTELAPRYDEYTHALGHASSEPMLHHHIDRHGLAERMLRFARCVSVDRT